MASIGNDVIRTPRCTGMTVVLRARPVGTEGHMCVAMADSEARAA